MELDETALIDVRGKQLDRLLKQSRTEILAGLGAVVLGVMLTSGVVPAVVALGWATLTALCYGSRYVLIELQNRQPVTDATVKRRSQMFIGTVAATGLCWGLFVAYALSRNELAHSAALPVLLLASAVCLLSIGAHAGSERAGLAAVLTTLAPPIVALLWHLNRLDIMAAVGVAALCGVAIYTVRSLKGQVWESIALRERNKNLSSYLDQRRDQVEKLNVELKTTLSKHDQAESNLRRTSADLGLVQGKAKALADTLERISPMCQVTGLANRRHFDQLMDAEWRRAAREGKVVSICLFDLDDTEEYLEAYGQQATDALLKRLAANLRGFARRAGDTAGRYEETKLALLLPGCDVRNASRMAEGARKRLEQQAVPHSNAKNRQVVTTHVGVAMLKPARSLGPGELLKRVDTALYEARFQGGNRVIAYQPLSKLRIERWDTPRDGPYNEQSLMQKLLVWGYDTTKLLMRPGTSVEPEIVAAEKVLAIASGELKIEVEGHTMNIKPGDCVFIPQGVELGLEVIGERPVLKFTAAKN